MTMPSTTDPLIVTHTDLRRFLQCKRSWYWSFIRDFNPEDRATGALALGSRVHAAVEAGYIGMMNGVEVDILDVYNILASEVVAELERRDAPAWEIDQLYDDIIVGRNCVMAYMDWLERTGANHGWLVDGVETFVEAPILGGAVLLRGKIDLRLRREEDDALALIDLKTTGFQLGAIRSELEKSYQLRLYRMIQMLTTPDVPVAGIGYDMIKKVTKKQYGAPSVERFFVPGILSGYDVFSRNIEGICRDMLMTIARLESEDMQEVCYPAPGDHCKFCAWKTPCLISDEASPEAVEENLTELFTNRRLARYSGGSGTD